MAPERVEQWVRRTERWGAKFYVMYGQTEATARMAYLPPEIARRRPSAIGRSIPGGCLELRPVDGLPDDVGELVDRGPNVMLGYATADADLALGATLTELPTGDIGRFHADDGVFEVVGRRARFVKPFGVRVDLDVLEQELGRTYAEVAVSGDDERLVVVAPRRSAAVVSRRVSESIGLPGSLITVDTTRPVPRTESGKVDYEAVKRRGEALRPRPDPVNCAEGSVAAVFAAVLGRPDVEPSSTFVSLGGDSLSYIECSLRLEQFCGSLPSDWHLRSVAELEVSDGEASFSGEQDSACRCLRALRRPHRYDVAVAVGGHLAPSFANAHARALLPRRRAPDAGRGRIQPEPLPAAHRRNCRARPGRDADRAIERRRPPSSGPPAESSSPLVQRRHPAVGQQLLRSHIAPRCAMALLVHRGVRPPDGAGHAAVRDSGGATPRTPVPVLVRPRHPRHAARSAARVGVARRLVQPAVPHARDRLVLRARLADPPVGPLVAARADVGAVPLDDPRLLQLSATRVVHRHRAGRPRLGA